MLASDCFADAYVSSLRELLENGEVSDHISDPLSIGSEFGRSPKRTTELRGFGFILKDPRKRLLPPALKPTSLCFALANTLWVIRGSNRSDEICFYNQRGKWFANEQGVVEAAFGPRIFGDRSAFGAAMEQLRRDPASRRSFIPVHWPVDLHSPTRDVPCLGSLQFMIRASKLDMVVNMRSQSVAMVMPYDVFLFSIIQEIAACELGTELGNYIHWCGSAHFYEDELATVRRSLDTGSGGDAIPAMPKMPCSTKTELLKIMELERALRTASRSAQECIEQANHELSPYWSQWILALAVGSGLLRSEGLIKKNTICEAFHPYLAAFASS